MRVIIKTIDKTKYDIEYEQNWTVDYLKEIIQEKLNIPLTSQRLLYQGSPLSSEMTLSNIPDGCIIHLIRQLETSE
jgi:hypothetical protein